MHRALQSSKSIKLKIVDVTGSYTAQQPSKYPTTYPGGSGGKYPSRCGGTGVKYARSPNGMKPPITKIGRRPRLI